MSNHVNDWIASSQFDFELIQGGNWEEDIAELLNNWSTSIKPREKSSLAKKVFFCVLNKLIPQNVERSEIYLLCDNLDHFEELIQVTRSGLGKKFYRDHLNHLIRVMLIAKYLVKKTPTILDPMDHNAFLLAAIFHDIGYPLSQISLGLEELREGIKVTYCTVSETNFSLKKNFPIVYNALNLICSSLPSDHREKFSKVLAFEFDKNHGTWSASELIGRCFLVDSMSPEIIKASTAIALHDMEYLKENSLDYTDFPLAALLIMCDEMQEWGRPLGLETIIEIKQLEKFIVNSNGIELVFPYNKSKKVPVFRQLWSKKTSLRRFRYPFNIKFTFLLPNYEKVTLKNLDTFFINIYKVFTSIVKLIANNDLNRFLNEFKDNFRLSLFKEEFSDISSQTRDEAGFIFSPERNSLVFSDIINVDTIELSTSEKNGMFNEFIIFNGKKIRFHIYSYKSNLFKEIFGVLKNNIFVIWNYFYIIGSFPEFYGPHDQVYDENQNLDLIPILDHFTRSKEVLEKNNLLEIEKIKRLSDDFETLYLLLELLRDYESNCFYFGISLRYLRKLKS